MASLRVQRHEWIHQVGLVALYYGIQRRSRDAGDLGVRLCLVSKTLNDADPAVLVNEEIPELSELVLELESICKVSHTSDTTFV